MAAQINRLLYGETLFDYTEDAQIYLQPGLNLAAVLSSPEYWGKRSLDYLWQGIGAYLAPASTGETPLWASFTFAKFTEKGTRSNCLLLWPLLSRSAKSCQCQNPLFLR